MSSYRTPHDAYGHNFFLSAIDDLTAMHPAGIKLLAAWLDISLKTMQRYIAGTHQPPRSVCFALYHETRWGRSLADSEAINNRQILVMQLNTAQAQNRAQAVAAALRDAEILQLKAALDGRNDGKYAANDAAYGALAAVKPARKPHLFAHFKARRVH